VCGDVANEYSPIPELNLLKEFEDGGDDYFAMGFELDGYGENDFLGDPRLIDGLIVFAAANASGSLYALWRLDEERALADLPVVMLGDEGGLALVARQLREFFQFLGGMDPGEEPWIIEGFGFRDAHGTASRRDEFVAWLSRRFGLAPAADPYDTVEAAEAEFGERFAAWIRPLVPGGVTEDVDQADVALEDANDSHRAGLHDKAVRELRRAAWLGDSDYVRFALEAAEEFALERAREGDRAAALTYVEGMLDYPVEADYPELSPAGILVYQGEPARAGAMYTQLTDHPTAHVRLLAAGRLLPLLADPGRTALLESQLGLLQHKGGDKEAALGTLRAAAAQQDPIASLALAKVLLWGGTVDEARGVLNRITELETTLACRALIRLSETCKDEPERRRELCLAALQAPVYDEPDTAMQIAARMALGWLAKQERDWVEATHWYQQVIDSGYEKQKPLAAAHLGELAYLLEDYDSAVRYYELTLATGTRHPDLVGEAAYRLGEVRYDQGDLTQAKEHLLDATSAGHDGFAERARTLLARLESA
jgi:tetratricopeptide (TPR) repeat protein